MMLSTTTLGCPAWDLPTILEQVRGCGMQAIDFRGYLDRVPLWERPEFSTQLAETAARIRDSGLAVTCISSGIKCVKAAPAERAERMAELDRCIALAKAFGCPSIRVFGGAFSELGLERPAAAALVASGLRESAERARDAGGISILIETHDAWTASGDLLEVIAIADHPGVAICWDIKHTYWGAQETPAFTWQRIGHLVRNTHWKDVRAGEDGHGDRLCLCGEGQVPLADAFRVLDSGGYRGPMTFEWEKRWHMHIEEPGTAFPHFAAFMRQLAAWRARTRSDDGALMGGRKP